MLQLFQRMKRNRRLFSTCLIYHELSKKKNQTCLRTHSISIRFRFEICLGTNVFQDSVLRIGKTK